MDPVLVAAAIFVISYAVIVAEWAHKTIVALLGASLVILFKVLDQKQAFEAIDLNVIFLLAGMMVLANVMATTGVFEWLAIRSAKLARGRPFLILVTLSVLTAAASAALDNVTTVVLLAPVTLFLASLLDMDPRPLLIAEVMASNIGGTATLIGDPPNILIGSASGLDFIAFLTNLAPVTLLILPVGILIVWALFRRQMTVAEDVRVRILEMREAGVIKDPALLRKSLLVLALTLVGFVLHGPLGYEPATIALLGASVLLLWSGVDPHHALREVEWTTLFFFIGLFILVGGIVHVGLIGLLAQAALQVTGQDAGLTAIALLWMSAVLSGVVDNIPYTATMLPLVQELAKYMPAEPLWWSLALGAGLGGNLTAIGASANVIVVQLAERSGYPISFRQFLLPGALVTLASMVICTVYVWVRYL